MNTSDGKRIFNRAISCIVGNVDVSELRVVFKVKRSLKPEPNTCALQIYNLSRDNRDALERATGGKLTCRLEAGYETTGTSQLFLGEARAAWSEQEGSDIVTNVQTGDSEKEIQEARLHMSVGPFVPADMALRAMVQALGVGEGNVEQAAALLRTKGVTTIYGPGTVLTGNVRQQLNDFARSAGLEWSIQDGRMQILDKGRALSELAVELSSTSGLIGSPSVDFKASSKTERGGAIVKAKALLIPELVPGRKVSFKTKSINGGYRIEQVEYSGDTHGQEWWADLVCRSY